MGAYFNMGRVGKDSDYVPRLGEVILHETDNYSGDKQYRTVVGDGRTPVGDLPSLADYDLHERVVRLEKEVERLKSDAPLELTPEDEGHYSSRLGDFYKIFSQNKDSWEFKAKAPMTEKDIDKVLGALKRLKNIPERD